MGTVGAQYIKYLAMWVQLIRGPCDEKKYPWDEQSLHTYQVAAYGRVI
jgi:hypothetical protein